MITKKSFNQNLEFYTTFVYNNTINSPSQNALNLLLLNSKNIKDIELSINNLNIPNNKAIQLRCDDIHISNTETTITFTSFEYINIKIRITHTTKENRFIKISSEVSINNISQDFMHKKIIPYIYDENLKLLNVIGTHLNSVIDIQKYNIFVVGILSDKDKGTKDFIMSTKNKESFTEYKDVYINSYKCQVKKIKALHKIIFQDPFEGFSYKWRVMTCLSTINKMIKSNAYVGLHTNETDSAFIIGLAYNDGRDAAYNINKNVISQCQ